MASKSPKKAGASPRKKPITAQDLWRIERVGAPSLSPDGAQAVAAVARFDAAANTGSSQLWLFSTLGGAPRLLTTTGDKDGSPQWGPTRRDGSELIAFTAKRHQEGSKDEQAQLYVLAPDGGEARRASGVATGVGSFKWCPGGNQLLFVSWVWPHLKGQKAQAAEHQAHSQRKETGYATSEAQYRYWDHNLPMGRVPHLHLLTLQEHGAGKVKDLFEGTDFELTRAEPNATHFDVSPDGKHVVFAFNPVAEKRGDGRFALAEMNLATGATTVIVQDKGWDMGSPVYSPSGQEIAFVASHQARTHTAPGELAVWQRGTAAKKANWKVLSTGFDLEVRAPLQWASDGDSSEKPAVLFATEKEGRCHLWRFDLHTQQAQVQVAGGWVGAFDQRAGTLVVQRDSAMHPAQLHVHSLADAAVSSSRIEHFNDTLMATVALGAVEEQWIEGATSGKDKTSGDRVQMWLTYPPGFNPQKKHPLMHNIHGGPHTGPGDNWHYRWNTQLFAAQGYVVASVNYHGSSGFGHAFLDSITHRWGELELQDIEAATTRLLKQRWADKTRVFATGGSYGGFMVAWMNAHVKPGRYRAYVCHAGCFDWVGMFADDAYFWHAKELGGWYWDDMAQVHSQSPHAYAATMNTPTLVVHGALDYRVPDAQGLAYYNTLKARGVDARLLWYPDENHWVLKPQNSLLWYREFFAWLQKHDPAHTTKAATQAAAKR